MAKKLNLASAQALNKKFAARFGWSVRPQNNENISGPGDKKFAETVYRIQHFYEGCQPNMPQVDPYAINQDCYNRDGIIGERTLVLFAKALVGLLPNAKYSDKLDTLYKSWIDNVLEIPTKYRDQAKTQTVLPPATDTDIPLPGVDTPPAVVEKKKPNYMVWGLGLGLAALAAFMIASAVSDDNKWERSHDESAA